MRLEASTKPQVHNLIHEFLINMTFTMADPNFKKGLKMVFGPLGVNVRVVIVVDWYRWCCGVFFIESISKAYVCVIFPSLSYIKSICRDVL
jgi:hypothetical protein